MQIDGRAAHSGTIVLAPGQIGDIRLPWGLFRLVCNPASPNQNVSLTTNPPQIVFDGIDNPLGVGTNLTIPLQGRPDATLNMVLYTIGEGATTTRVLHYTAG